MNDKMMFGLIFGALFLFSGWLYVHNFVFVETTPDGYLITIDHDTRNTV